MFVIGLLLMRVFAAPFFGMLGTRHPTVVRCAMVLGAGVLGGGFAPMIATSLLACAGGNPRYVVAYLIGLGVFALICTAFMRAPRH